MNETFKWWSNKGTSVELIIRLTSTAFLYDSLFQESLQVFSKPGDKIFSFFKADQVKPKGQGNLVLLSQSEAHIFLVFFAKILQKNFFIKIMEAKSFQTV